MEIKNCICGKQPIISPVMDFDTWEHVGYKAACHYCLRIVAKTGKDRETAIRNWNKEIEWYVMPQ